MAIIQETSRARESGSCDEVLARFDSGRAPAGDSKSGIRQTEVKSTTLHAAAGCFRCMLELLCLARASYTSLRHTHTYTIPSHLTSPHSGPIDLTSLDRPHLHPHLFQSLPPLPLTAVCPRSAYRKHLSKPGVAGPENHQASRGITFRRATVIPWIPPHPLTHRNLLSLLSRMAGATIPA